MVRKIVKIDEEKCNGCGLCAQACHEGAIGIVNGKAKLLRDDYCDGLGACLPSCPTEAIGFEEREAEEYNEAAVIENKSKINETKPHLGCPGTSSKVFERKELQKESASIEPVINSRLSQWPVQIKLVPVNAPYFENANLLIAADCTAYAYGDFHNKFIKNRIALIGCPKLDDGDYSEKLTAIIKNNNIKSVTIVRMEVPCCGGIENATKNALMKSGKMIPWQVVTISTDGRILE
jgi:MinD superfamily P-loop ATPase containing an inserted ferredoxin domain